MIFRSLKCMLGIIEYTIVNLLQKKVDFLLRCKHKVFSDFLSSRALKTNQHVFYYFLWSNFGCF